MYRLYESTIALLLILMGCAGLVTAEAPQVFGVVIGDSIAEGHPALHGALHPGRAAYDPTYASQPGQLSYELGVLSGYHWYNNGIGSQSTEHIRARWNRDALGRQDDPQDGRGNRTLPGTPYAVVVAAGVNDISLKVPAEATRANLRFMADSLNSAGAYVVFLTLPPSNRATSEQIQMVQDMNTWMFQNLPSERVGVVDLYAWFEDPQNPGKVNSALAADYIHPSKDGYKELASLAWAVLSKISSR